MHHPANQPQFHPPAARRQKDIIQKCVRLTTPRSDNVYVLVYKDMFCVSPQIRVYVMAKI